MISFSHFPKFWLDLEAQRGEYAEDLIQVKSVYTILGFSTKQSVASIKTARKINSLESEYLKIVSANAEGIFARYSELKQIQSFTPGMKLMMINIATHLNESKQGGTSDNCVEKIRKNIFERAKKV